MECAVYQIRNKLSNKLYIGKSIDHEYRWKVHQRIAIKGKASYPKLFSYLHAALRKHGIENFEHTVLAILPTEEKAFEQERVFIEKFRTNNPKFGYNLNGGGKGGFKPSPKTIRKLSLSHKGRKHTLESRKKMSLAKKGKPLSKEAKENRPSRKGSSNSFYGKEHTKESKKKISDSKKGQNSGDQHYFYGKNHSQSTKEKISKAKQGMQAKEDNPFWGKEHSKKTCAELAKKCGKLTEEKVKTIRNEFKKGIKTQLQLAKEFSVSPAALCLIINRKTWKHI